MKYLIAPSAFKGSFSPSQVAQAIADGINKFSTDSEVLLTPIADGGDGTLEALNISRGGKLNSLVVPGPLGDDVTAQWLELKSDGPNQSDLVVLELASACGLAYIAPDRSSSLDASTVGLGLLIDHCVWSGSNNIAIAVGGSASTDGGMGILTALGARFFDEGGRSLAPGGRNLGNIRAIDLAELARFADVRFGVLTDVVNPLTGKNGAAAIFGPQKGAGLEEIELLESGLTNYANLLEAKTGKALRMLPGAGAAGGVPFGLAAALGAEIIPGFQWISSTMNLEQKVKDSDLVITGEGSLDSQSLSGKASGELAEMCSIHGKRLWIVAGSLEPGIDWTVHGIERAIGASPAGAFATLQDISDSVALACRLH